MVTRGGILRKMVKTSTAKEPNSEKVQIAKRAFFVALFDLTWRLLAAMLLPIFVGLLIDSLFSTNKVFATIGFAVGAIAGIFVIRATVRKVSEGRL